MLTAFKSTAIGTKTYVEIDELMNTGVLREIFQNVVDNLTDRVEPKQKNHQAILREFMGPNVPKQFSHVINGLLSDGRYPPTSPEEICEIIKDADKLIEQFRPDPTVTLSWQIKAAIADELKIQTGIDYKIL